MLRDESTWRRIKITAIFWWESPALMEKGQSFFGVPFVEPEVIAQAPIKCTYPKIYWEYRIKIYPLKYWGHNRLKLQSSGLSPPHPMQ